MMVAIHGTEAAGFLLLWCGECGPLCVADDYPSARKVAHEHLTEHGV